MGQDRTGWDGTGRDKIGQDRTGLGDMNLRFILQCSHPQINHDLAESFDSTFCLPADSIFPIDVNKYFFIILTKAGGISSRQYRQKDFENLYTYGKFYNVENTNS